MLDKGTLEHHEYQEHLVFLGTTTMPKIEQNMTNCADIEAKIVKKIRILHVAKVPYTTSAKGK